MQVENESAGKKNITHILFLTALLVMPGAIWELFGWVTIFLPLTAFVFIHKYGWNYTNRHIVIAILAAMITGVFLKTLESTVFSVAFIPAGYAIAYEAQQKKEPWVACLKGASLIALSLFALFGIFFSGSENGVAAALHESIIQAEEVRKQYLLDGSITQEASAVVEQLLAQFKMLIPIVPAVLVIYALLISWLTAVLGNIVLEKLEIQPPWPKYRTWSLPDKLIWLLIISGLMALIPGKTTQIIGINILLIVAIMYFFQGLAILVFWVNKWNIPRMFRTVIYIFMILQSFGTIILVGIGIADVWVDTRRQRSQQIDNNESE